MCVRPFYYGEAKNSTTATTARHDFPLAGFGGGGWASDAAVAGISAGEQEADQFISRCRRCGVVQEGWAGLSEEDPSGALGDDEGRAEDVGGMRRGVVVLLRSG